jgi:hypothetical protein
MTWKVWLIMDCAFVVYHTTIKFLNEIIQLNDVNNFKYQLDPLVAP